MTLSDSFEIVVIGGGAVGASILWHLAAAGRTDIALIEKHELTAGSTWHAAGNVPTFSNTWLGQRAGNYAWRLYSSMASDPEHPITYRHTRAFWPGHTESRIDHFHEVVSISTGLGLDLQLVSPREMAAMHPFWEDDGTVIAGLLDPYEGDIDPSALTQAFARRARALGAQIRRHTEVVGLNDTGSYWEIETVSGGATATIGADTVINAAGFYGAQVSAMAGVRAPLSVLEHQYLLTGPVPELAARSAPFPLVRDPEIMFYLRQEQDRLLFGNYGHEGRSVWENGPPATFDSSLFVDSTDDIGEVAARAAAHVPLLGEVGIAEFVNGPITYSPDANPIVGPVAEARSFYQAVGVQIGITHAAAVGKVLTEMITEGDTEWDVWPWDPRRFGEWSMTGSGRNTYANARVRELYEHQYAEPFPHRVWQAARPVKQSPLYATLAGRGARFGQIGGWERALWFGGEPYDHHTASYRDEHWHPAVAAECRAVRDHVGVMDHCGFTRFDVRGPDAAALLDRIFCSKLPPVGRVRLAYMLRPNGSVWSEATIARLAQDEFLVLGPTAARERDLHWIQAHVPVGADVQVRHGQHRTSTLMVMGPKSRELLSRVCPDPLGRDAAPWMSVQQLTVAGVAATGLRVSFVGELGWELHVDDQDLPQLYGALHDAGADLSLTDFGSYALNSMRVEKGYHGWGSEFGVEYTPWEAGLHRFVALNKSAFIGQDAARTSAEQPVAWTYGMWTVDIAELSGAPGDPAPSATIRQNGRAVGFVTSASFGFRTNQRVCLGYVKGALASADGDFTIDVHGTPCPAFRQRGAVYDPLHERPRS